MQVSRHKADRPRLLANPALEQRLPQLQPSQAILVNPASHTRHSVTSALPAFCILHQPLACICMQCPQHNMLWLSPLRVLRYVCP